MFLILMAKDSKNSVFYEVKKNGDILSINGDKKVKISNAKTSIDSVVRVFEDKYNLLKFQIESFASRLENISHMKIEETLEHFENAINEQKMIGDIQKLNKYFLEIKEKAHAQDEINKKRNRDNKATAINNLENIILSLQNIVDKDIKEINFTNSNKNIKQMVSVWKEINRKTRSIDRKKVSELYSKFKDLLTKYNKLRNENYNSFREIIKKKQLLFKKAKEIIEKDDSDSVEKLKSLQREWREIGMIDYIKDKNIGRQFTEIINKYFEEKNISTNSDYKEQKENFSKKMEIIKDIEKLLPTNNLSEFRPKWNEALSKMDEIGRVRTNDNKILNNKINKIQSKINEKVESEWNNNVANKQSRALGSVSDLQNKIQKLEKELEAAKKEKNKKLISKITDSIKVKTEWLKQIEKITV